MTSRLVVVSKYTRILRLEGNAIQTFKDEQDQANISQLDNSLFGVGSQKLASWCAPGNTDEDLADKATK